MPEKSCARCKKRPRASHVSYCASCWNAYQSEYRRRRYAEEPDYREKIKRKARMRRYGVTPEQYDEILERQGNVCAICATRPNGKELGVDHNHETGAVRGLLCTNCNGAIGMLREDPDLFASALRYLESHA